MHLLVHPTEKLQVIIASSSASLSVIKAIVHVQAINNFCASTFKYMFVAAAVAIFNYINNNQASCMFRLSFFNQFKYEKTFHLYVNINIYAVIFALETFLLRKMFKGKVVLKQ